MSQLMNQGTNSASLAQAPMKRRRGRPRKDENQAHPKPLVPRMQGEGSGALKPTASISLKDKDSVNDVDDDDCNNDKLVGQVVTGVLEYAFDAGYVLTVRVGNSNVCMRGVVFKEDCVAPITPENDIAPNLKMYESRDLPIPRMKSNPQIVPTVRIPSLNSMENIENQLPREKVISESGSQKEDHDLLRKGQLNEDPQETSLDKEQQEMQSSDKALQEMLSNDKEQQDMLSNDKEQQEMLLNDKVLQENLSNNDKVQQEKLPDDSKEQRENLSDDKDQQAELLNDMEQQAKLSDDKIGLEDLSERPLKFQKTNQTTESFVNGVQIKLSGVADGNSDDAVKSDEASNVTVLSKEAIIVSPEMISEKEDSSLVASTMMEQEFRGTPGFQVSMEIGDDEVELSEMQSDITPMAAE